MPEIKFLIDETTVNTLTWEEFEAFEKAQEGSVKLREIRPILARFMVNGGDKPMPHDVAMRILGKLPVAKIRETVELFTEALKTGTVPLATGKPSSLPSEVEAEASPSPAG